MFGIAVLNWLKKYWHWVALGIGIIALATYLRQDFINDRALNTLIDNLRENSEAHLKEIERLEEINEEKTKKLKKLDEKYQQEIKKLEKQHEDKIKNIETKTIVVREKIIKDAYQDPNTLTKKVEEVFGIPYWSKGVEKQ